MRRDMVKVFSTAALVLLISDANARSWPECEQHISAHWGDVVEINRCVAGVLRQSTGINYQHEGETPEAIYEKLATGENKVAYVSVGTFLSLSNSNSLLMPIASLPMETGEIGFHSQLISKDLTELSEATSLDPKAIGLFGGAEITGMYAPLQAIYSSGDNGEHKLMDHSLYGYGVENGLRESIGALDAGAVDVISVWSSSETKDSLAKLNRDPSDYNTIWESPMIPHSAIVVSTDVPKGDIEKFENMLMNLEDDAIECIDNAVKWDFEKFVPVNESNFTYVEGVYKKALQSGWASEHHK